MITTNGRAGEREFLAAYRPGDFPPFALTVDLAVFTIRAGPLAVLLVQRRLPHRAIQIGLSEAAGHRYVDEWICSISDITPVVRLVEQLVRADRVTEAMRELRPERAYPIDPRLASRIGAGT
jgi:Domain of unknown function (DUF4291)